MERNSEKCVNVGTQWSQESIFEYMEDVQVGILMDQYILVGGSANPPKETGVYNLYNVVSVSMYVDRKTNCVVKAKLNVPSELTQDYMADILEGYCLLESPEPIYQKVRENMLISSANAVNQALKVAFSRYRDKIGNSEK